MNATEMIASSLGSLSNREVEYRIEGLVELCHGSAKDGGWWTDLETGGPLARNNGEMIALMHSELSEALEGLRKNKMDDHLPHRLNVEVEMADVLIRVFDFCGGLGLDVGGAMAEKLVYNQQREDHKIENRKKEDGKKI